MLSTVVYIMYLFLFLSSFLYGLTENRKKMAVCPELVNSHYSTK